MAKRTMAADKERSSNERFRAIGKKKLSGSLKGGSATKGKGRPKLRIGQRTRSELETRGANTLPTARE